MPRHLHIVNTKRLQHDDFVSTFDTVQPEAASACSPRRPARAASSWKTSNPRPRLVTTWTRIKRAVRAWWVSRTYKT